MHPLRRGVLLSSLRRSNAASSLSLGCSLSIAVCVDKKSNQGGPKMRMNSIVMSGCVAVMAIGPLWMTRLKL